MNKYLYINQLNLSFKYIFRRLAKKYIYIYTKYLYINICIFLANHLNFHGILVYVKGIVFDIPSLLLKGQSIAHRSTHFCYLFVFLFSFFQPEIV